MDANGAGSDVLSQARGLTSGAHPDQRGRSAPQWCPVDARAPRERFIASMMIDYKISDHWSDDEPAWVKSLVSSLDRRHGLSTVIPLTVLVEEVVEWVELASGIDAWRKVANRESLQLDLAESVQYLGPVLRNEVSKALKAFQAALDELVNSPARVLSQPPGIREDVAWGKVVRAAHELLLSLDSDAAVRASWDDLVGTAQNRTLENREYRPIAELLFDQLRRRRVDPQRVFDDLVDAMAFGRDPADSPLVQRSLPVDERTAKAREIACTPAEVEPVVVWLGYKGRIFSRLNAGRVSFLDAHWAVPNARPDGQPFEHKDELWELVEHGMLFKVAARVDEKSEVDFLVRVDLGVTAAAGAVTRATDVVNTILNVSIHNAGGLRPHLAQYGVLQSGREAGAGFLAVHGETGFPDDYYGAGITGDAIEAYGPRVAEALAREDLPRFLAAALEVQVTADHPFSRDMALRRPSEADISSVVPLGDRVVQHVAAYAGLDPVEVFNLLGKRWPHLRWLADIQRAVQICLFGGGQRDALRDELTREWYARTPPRPWILLVADRATDLLSLCRVESERAWVEAMFASVSDIVRYHSLHARYTAEAVVLEARRRRLRNALVHGNPASFAAVASVREYAEFLSSSALNSSLTAYIEGARPAVALAYETEESTAMRAGQDAASFWRAELAGKSPAAG